jgi:hypothetical protein
MPPDAIADFNRKSLKFNRLLTDCHVLFFLCLRYFSTRVQRHAVVYLFQLKLWLIATAGHETCGLKAIADSDRGKGGIKLRLNLRRTHRG